MWSLGFLLILGTVSLSQKSNGVLLSEERGKDPCRDNLSKIILGAISNGHRIADSKPKLIMGIVFPNFADIFPGNGGNNILSQGNGVEFSIPDLDPEDPIHQINIHDWDRGTLANGMFIPKFGHVRDVPIPRPERPLEQIVYHFPERNYKPIYSNPNKSRKDDIKKVEDKLEYTSDIFEGLDTQEAEQGTKEEEAKEMEEAKKLEETKKPEETKKTEASVPESGSPQNRINYRIYHHKNANKNGNINSNLNSHRHKYGLEINKKWI